jgi:hypothetical protein
LIDRLARSTPCPSRDDHVTRELRRIAACSRGRGRLHDEQPDRVRPLVYRGHAAGALLRVYRLHVLGDPDADRIDAAGQVEGVVGMQALHAATRPADAAVLARLRQIARAFLGVGVMRGAQGVGERGIRPFAFVEAGDIPPASPGARPP